MSLHLLKQATLNVATNLLHIYNFIHIYKSIKDNAYHLAQVRFCSITTVVYLSCYFICLLEILQSYR